ncbi:hypothetical protein JZO82_00290 [Vagococcus fluvialis]|uniref:hypothetical protein n=1 Tax=Vagococcus fluvialis TaxID=2738 RepID=UPI001A8FDB05|nr:hypothetical protein [Vagococcus fluvialis]MBO0427590.1 hypothetical protein [Vagococcus fluvialis]
MELEITLRNGEVVQVNDFKEFTMAFREFDTFTADKISSVMLIDDATYSFKGNNFVMLSGKDILYLNII